MFHDQVELEDMKFDPVKKIYTYPCPCGDVFYITEEQVKNGEDVAVCETCPLMIRVIYELPDD